MTWRQHARRRLVALFATLLLVVPAVAHGQAVTAAWDPSPPADQVTGYQVCVGTSSLSCNVALASVGGSTTTYRFTPAGGTLYHVATRATNAAGASPYSSEVRFSIPSFVQPANQTSTAGTAIAPLTVSITDPDGSPLTITHTGLPVGLSINSGTRQITGTPSAAGTYNVTVFANDGLVTVSRSFAWTVTSTSTDLIWRNKATGQNMAWHLRGTTVFSSEWLPTVADTNWQAAVRADIDRDGTPDVIWRNKATGENMVWYLSGTTVFFSEWLPTVADTNWQLVASADINRDGAPDLIWRNRVTGENMVWYLSGTTVFFSEWLPTVADTNWQLVASADINRDGAPDLIWHNHASGQNMVWYLRGTAVFFSAWLPTATDKRWRLVTVLDMNNDGAADLFLRHDLTGDNYVWYLNQATLIGGAYFPMTVSDLNWQIMGAR